MHEPPNPERGGTPPADGAASAPSPSTAPSRRSGALARLALIGLLILAAAAVYGWFDLRREALAFRTEVAQRLTVADAAQATARARASDLGNDLREAQAKLALLEAKLAESQSQQAALEALYREMTPSREELTLTEVEQILSLASQQLTLAGNVQAALAALQLADGKLARLDRPQYTTLRRSLARDMEALKAVPYVDVAGISVKLDQVLEAVDDLRLARDERLPEEPASTVAPDEPRWRRFLHDAWGELRSLVRIEVSDRPPAPLLTPEETFFLRENLKLRVLSARLALLARDQRSFKTDLAAAQKWLDRYFDLRAKPVMNVAATLEQLESTPMPTGMPDLSASLDAVRLLRAMAERQQDAQAPDALPPAGEETPEQAAPGAPAATASGRTGTPSSSSAAHPGSSATSAQPKAPSPGGHARTTRPAPPSPATHPR